MNQDEVVTLNDLNRNKPNDVPMMTDIYCLVQELQETYPFIRNITIGVSDDPVLLEKAEQFKHLFENVLNDKDFQGSVVHIVKWKENSTSMKKFEKSFVQYDPDVWIVMGRPLGFSRLLKRLYRNERFDPKRTYCFGPLCSETMIQTVGPKYFEGIQGLTMDQLTWRVKQGRIHVSTS